MAGKLASLEGTWELLPGTSKDDEKKLKDLLTALGKIDMLDFYLHSQTTMNNKYVQEGDKWETRIKSDGEEFGPIHWKIGQEYETLTMINTKTKTTPIIDEDGALIEDHEVETADGNKAIMKTKITIKDDKMFWRAVLDNLEFQQVYKKV